MSAPGFLAPNAVLAKPPAAALTPQTVQPTPVVPQPQVPPSIDPALQQNFQRNQQFLAEGDHSYNTQLTPEQELQFRQWVTQNGVPFDPNAHVTDYDMRGFWAALQAGDSKAQSAIDPNDKRLHYPDYWKTPYHQTFSNESQWAGKNAPKWNDKDQLVAPDGTVLFDDKAAPQ